MARADNQSVLVEFGCASTRHHLGLSSLRVSDLIFLLFTSFSLVDLFNLYRL